MRLLGSEPFKLTGPFLRGSQVSMGRFAVVDAGALSVLLTERPAYTFDPETFRHARLGAGGRRCCPHPLGEPVPGGLGADNDEASFSSTFPERALRT